MAREELASWLRLTLTPGIGNKAARQLLAAFGLPASVFRQSPAAVQQVVAPAQAKAKALQQEPGQLAALLDQTLEWLQRSGAEGATRRILTLADPDYPARCSKRSTRP